MRVDWAALLEDLRDAGISSVEVARQLQIGERTVRYWREQLTQPTHFTGERVIALYCRVLRVERDRVPVLDQAGGKTFPQP